MQDVLCFFGCTKASICQFWGPAIVQGIFNGLGAYSYYVILCCAWGTSVSPFVGIVEEREMQVARCRVYAMLCFIQFWMQPARY